MIVLLVIASLVVRYLPLCYSTSPHPEWNTPCGADLLLSYIRFSFLIDCKWVILHHLTILSFPMVRHAWDNLCLFVPIAQLVEQRTGSVYNWPCVSSPIPGGTTFVQRIILWNDSFFVDANLFFWGDFFVDVMFR